VPEAIRYLIGLGVSAGFSAIGWFIAHNPGRTYRAFNWGKTQFGERFGMGFFRIVGWCFAFVFAAGLVFYAAQMVYALVH
jgi:hypothetical protein